VSGQLHALAALTPGKEISVLVWETKTLAHKRKSEVTLWRHWWWSWFILCMLRK